MSYGGLRERVGAYGSPYQLYLEALKKTGETDNTVEIYLMGDNVASAEDSPYGLLDEVTFIDNIPVPFEEILARMDELGGSKTFRRFSAAWGTHNSNCRRC